MHNKLEERTVFSMQMGDEAIKVGDHIIRHGEKFKVIGKCDLFFTLAPCKTFWEKLKFWKAS